MGCKELVRPALSGLKAHIRNAGERMRISCSGVRVGRGVELRRVRFSPHVAISDHVDLDDADLGEYVNIAHHVQIAASKIGKRTSVGRYTKVRNAQIGAYCSISWDVTIGATSHMLEAPSSHAFWYRSQFGLVEEDASLASSPINIGNDVWIGCGAILMPGIEVGDGAVIGAGAVVTKNVNPYTVVAGVPATFLKRRFTLEDAARLEAIRWWDWEDEMIEKNIALFKSPLTSETLEEMGLLCGR